jgi:hypothetical protein
MFDANQQPTNEQAKFPNPYELYAQIEKMKAPEAIKKIAKERADMKAAIAAAPTYNIRSQLRYRLNHGVYQYDDLIDQKSVIESINKPIAVNPFPTVMQPMGGYVYGTSNTDAK